MDRLFRFFRNTYGYLRDILFPLYSGDLVETRMQEQGRFVIFALSQIGALLATSVLLYVYIDSSPLIASVIALAMVLIVANCALLRRGIIAFDTAALVFAANAFITQTVLLLKSDLHAIAINGFFPSVIAGFLFLGIRIGSFYATMYIVLLWVYHALYATERLELTVQMLALSAAFLIALFYELASLYHRNVLSLSLERMSRLAKTDQLTGILNRREFFHQAERLLGDENEASLLMLDIDDFKRINDTYGHAMGDQVLRSVSQTIKSYIREDEIFSRIGGEEFAVLLPLEISVGYERAERIRKAVENLVFKRENIDVRLTLSIGITRIDPSESNVNDVLKRADLGLYKAKENGKNRTVIWN